MKISQTYIQRVKAGVHFVQLFFIFIGGCLALAVLTKTGETGGQVGYYFALCFLSMPGLIYQIMVPMWTRAWRFANVYAYATIDLLYTLLWFASFVAVAAWRGSGLNGKPKDNTKDQTSQKSSGGCSNFAYGSASKCETAGASVGFGVIVFLLFGITSAISIQGVMKYRSTGVMPNGNSKTHGKAVQIGEDPGKDPWSTNTDELDSQHMSNRPSTDNDDPRRAYGQIPQEDDGENLLHRPSTQNDNPFNDAHATEHGMHPGRPVSFLSGTSSLSIVPPPSCHERPAVTGEAPSPSGYVAPSALSPSDYEQAGAHVNFPQGNYGRI